MSIDYNSLIEIPLKSTSNRGFLSPPPRTDGSLTESHRNLRRFPLHHVCASPLFLAPVLIVPPPQTCETPPLGRRDPGCRFRGASRGHHYFEVAYPPTHRETKISPPSSTYLSDSPFILFKSDIFSCDCDRCAPPLSGH